MISPSKNLFTFWSMEPPYAEGKLRYHLGQVAMLERMAKNILAGGRSSAVICDPPVILSARARPNAEMQRETIENFIRRVGDSNIKVYLLSDLNADFRTRDEVKYGLVEAELLVSFAQFNSVSSGLQLSTQALSDLASFRSGSPKSVPLSLNVSLAKLKEHFSSDEQSLLTTLYAFKHRASWFESHHIAATAATLSILGEINADPRPPIILEADRNAYPWLVLKFLYDQAKQRANISQNYWPNLELCANVPSIDGNSFMRLSESGGCLFLDEPYKNHAAALSRLSKNFIDLLAKRFPDFITEQDARKDVSNLLGTYRTRALKEGFLKNILKTDPEDSDNVNLILGGGGAKGIALVSATDELWKHYNFTHFWGTSAGSIVAVLLGAGYTPAELGDVLTTTSFESFLDRGVFRKIWNCVRYRALHTGTRFEPWLDELLKFKLGTNARPLMKHLKKRTTVFGSQSDKGTVRYDSEGENQDTPASFAVRSSISYPFFFKPVKLYGKPVYDGGVINNFPFRQFKLSNPDTAFIGIALRSTAKNTPKVWHSMIPSTFKDLFKISTNQDEDTIFDENKDNIIVLDTNPVGTFDIALQDSEINYLIALGKHGACNFLLSRGLQDSATLEDRSKELDSLRTKLNVKGSERIHD